MVPKETATTKQVHCSHACASRDISGMTVLLPVMTLTSVSLAPTTVSHQPDASIHQGPTAASALRSWDGRSMVNRATTPTNATILMSVTHKLHASITLEDLTAAVILDGEDKDLLSILYVLILTNVQRELIGNSSIFDFRF